MAINATFLEQDKQTPAEVAAQLADFLNAARPACTSPSTTFASATSRRPHRPGATGPRRGRRGRADRLRRRQAERRLSRQRRRSRPPGTADFVRRLGDNSNPNRSPAATRKCPN